MSEGAAGVVVAAAYAVTVVATAATELSDVEALKISVSAGVLGGVIATLLRKDAAGWREVIGMILASAMFSPAIVYGWMIYDKTTTLTLYPVAITSMLAGLFAWLVFSKLTTALQGVSTSDIRDWLLGLLRRNK